MSCNPSIGGIGKGHLVKEIDALGGAMAAAADEAGIHFRILNGSKGPAVRATRAQADRVLYKAAIRRRLENQPNLCAVPGRLATISSSKVTVLCGVITQVGVRFDATCVVLTAGTFLDGRIHVGLDSHPGGRVGRSAGRDAVGAAEGAEAAARPAEDRNAAAPRRPHHRLSRSSSSSRATASARVRRRRPAGVQLSRRSAPASAPGLVLDHADQRAHPRDHPGRLRRRARCSPG